MTSPTPAPTTRSVSFTDLGLLVFLGAVWGGAFLAFRIAAPEVGPVWAAEARLAIAAVVLAVVAGPRTLRMARGRLVRFAVVGATFSAIPFTLIAVAALTLPTGFGALLNAATPLFTAMLGVAVLGQRMPRRAVAGLAIGVGAVVVLVGWSPLEIGLETLIAVAAALGAAFSYAVAGTFVRRTLPDVGGIELATAQLVSASLLLLPIAALTGAPGVPSGAGIAALLLVGTVSTALAWPLFFRVLGRTTPTAASTVTFIVPAFAIVWGAMVLGEPVGPELIAGFALILVSLALVLGLPMPRVAVAGRIARRTTHAVRAAASAVLP